jgi:hypothetical protein
MTHLIWWGAAGVGIWLFATKTAAGKSLVSKGRGMMTPARAAVHGHLMGYEMSPHKLSKAAHLFAAEGLTQEAKQLDDKARTIGLQMKASVDLAERARAGDQNAMAMIAACREQAKAGNKRAFVTCMCIEHYCKNNPMQQNLGEPPPPSAHGEPDAGEPFHPSEDAAA